MVFPKKNISWLSTDRLVFLHPVDLNQHKKYTVLSQNVKVVLIFNIHSLIFKIK